MSAYHAIIANLAALQGRGILSQLDRNGFAVAHYAAARSELGVLRFLSTMRVRCTHATRKVC